MIIGGAAMRVFSMLAPASKSRPSGCSFQKEPITPSRYRDHMLLISGAPPPTVFVRSLSVQASTKLPLSFMMRVRRSKKCVLTPILLEDDGSLSASKYPIAPPPEHASGHVALCYQYYFTAERTGNFSCNGLLCYPVGDDEVFVWNPTTLETRKLPDSPFFNVPGVRKFNLFTATWADSDNYKVLRFYTDSDPEADYSYAADKCEIELYSLETDSWKQMFFADLTRSDMERSHCYANGAIHMTYSIRRSFRISERLMLSFDFRSETFSTSPFPESAPKFYPQLVAYNGQPSLYFITNQVNDNDDRNVPHYVMRKNGEWEYLGQYLVNLFHTPLGFARNGELMLLEFFENPDSEDPDIYFTSKLGVFDFTTGEFKYVPGCESYGVGLLPFEFHETFVKLKPASANES